MSSLTVCIATFNGGSRLAVALDSVFQQTFRDFDVLVLDDGSTDDTAEVANRYPVRYVRQENTGLGGARKAMVELAQSDLIAFLDDDDQWLPNKLEVQVPAHLEAGVVLSHTGGFWQYPDGRRELREIKVSDPTCSYDHVLPELMIMAPTVIFNREAMLRAGNFVPEVRICSDWYGWLILAHQGDYLFIDEPLLLYSRREGQNTSPNFRFYDSERFLLEEKVLPRWDWIVQAAPAQKISGYKQQLTKYLADNKSVLAWLAFCERRDRRLALKHILGSIRLNPRKHQNYRILQKILTYPLPK